MIFLVSLELSANFDESASGLLKRLRSECAKAGERLEIEATILPRSKSEEEYDQSRTPKAQDCEEHTIFLVKKTSLLKAVPDSIESVGSEDEMRKYSLDALRKLAKNEGLDNIKTESRGSLVKLLLGKLSGSQTNDTLSPQQKHVLR